MSVGPTIPKIEENSIPLNVPSIPKRQFGHRASRSVSSLPLDLQSLSLQGPEDMSISPSPLPPQTLQPQPLPPQPLQAPPPPQQRQLQQQMHHQPQPYGGIPFSSGEKAPSWMIPNDRPSMLNIPLPNSSSSYGHNRRKPSFAGHGRSVSEFTLPPLSHNNSPSLSQSNTPPPPPSTTITTTTTTATNRRRTSSHRRAVSANTVDFMLSPAPPSGHHRAQSYSPQESALSPAVAATAAAAASYSPPNSNNNNNNQQFFEQLDVASTADNSGRYVCPYCQKKFSRPSSLRIHTYSHTGEKPFVCTEPGCGRHFSVQSNMRRHLRVHRLGRGGSNSSNNLALETTNEE